MLMLDDYQELLRKVERLKRSRDRAQGELDQLMKRLRSKVKCTTLKEAELKLNKMEKQERNLAREYTAAKKDFLKKHRKALK